MKRRKLAAGVAVLVLAAGLATAISWPSRPPRPHHAATVASCAGDRDNDCPAGEPDNDGHRAK